MSPSKLADNADGKPYDEASIRELFGFAPDDPNVQVVFHPAGTFDDILDDIKRATEDLVTGRGNEFATADAIEANRTAREIVRDCLDFERKCQDEALAGGADIYAKMADEIKAQGLDGRPIPETAAEINTRLAFPLDAIINEVRDEVLRANAKHPPMHSPHEGYSVILEELDELWDEVKADRGRQASARKEAMQVACTAIRYILDLDPH